MHEINFQGQKQCQQRDLGSFLMKKFFGRHLTQMAFLDPYNRFNRRLKSLIYYFLFVTYYFLYNQKKSEGNHYLDFAKEMKFFGIYTKKAYLTRRLFHMS